MAYRVKEMYFTLQGEGAQAGRPAVFCRFAGCNLWNGKEQDRGKAKCWFCDTDFVGTNGPGGGSFQSATELAISISAQWPESHRKNQLVVFTGGEPLLQLDEALVHEMHRQNFEIAVESNGTLAAPPGIDWITVSPKPNSELVQKTGSELKLVYPQDLHPSSFENLDFKYFYLSPRWSKDPLELEQHVAEVIEYCKQNPHWRLTMQYHKVWRIP